MPGYTEKRTIFPSEPFTLRLPKRTGGNEPIKFTMLTFNKLCERVQGATSEKFTTWDFAHSETIEFLRIPLCIDLETLRDGNKKIWLHDYGFGDGPEDITDYYIGASVSAMLRRLQNAINDVSERMKQS